jgi:hypothetical protein
MSYTNNIYMFYIDGFHNKTSFLIYEKFYNDMGFNVKTFGAGDKNGIDYSKSINDLFEKEDEEVFVIIDNLIIPNFVLHQAIDLCERYECLVKPSNKIYMIDDESQAEKILESLTSNEILENFNYSDMARDDFWPLNGAWVVHSKSIKNTIDFNAPVGYDFEFCYNFAFEQGVIFIQSDSYKLNPDVINIDENILFICKSYLSSIKNLFGTPRNVYLYQNQSVNEVDECLVEDKIFNINKYFSKTRYI